ncbi:MAG: hypothetical protein AAF456_11910 [Planctomycetota bacterium]
MTKQLITSTMAVLALVAFSSTSANAQDIIMGPGGAVASPMVGMPGYYDPGYRGPYWDPYRPSLPVAATPNVITGYNPWTGGWNTANTQVNDTRFDFGRDMSANNGSRRWVNRPVYDAWGNITGYQQGYVWNNSFTGQEHGHLNTVTPNGMGGDHNTTVMYSMAHPDD